MIPDDVVRLPAGWYPDPTGLPQLRWWDNHAWTQHTTAARQPLVVQESPLAWADDLPSRRERREREREDRGTDDLDPPTAQSLLELAPPSADGEPSDESAPQDAELDEPHPEAGISVEPASYGPLSASGHAGRIPSLPSLDVREPRQDRGNHGSRPRIQPPSARRCSTRSPQRCPATVRRSGRHSPAPRLAVEPGRLHPPDPASVPHRSPPYRSAPRRPGPSRYFPCSSSSSCSCS